MSGAAERGRVRARRSHARAGGGGSFQEERIGRGAACKRLGQQSNSVWPPAASRQPPAVNTHTQLSSTAQVPSDELTEKK